MQTIQKRITMLVLILFAACVVKMEANAEVVWNYDHELFDNITDYTTMATTPTPYKYKVWRGTGWGYHGIGSFPTDEDRTVPITYKVTYNYEKAYKLLDLVNEERRKAGVPELKSNDRIMQVAMERAAQTCCYWTHSVPDGTGVSEFSMFIDGENILSHTGWGDASNANISWVKSKGHYKNMIDKSWKYAGFGCVETPEGGRWVQIFCNNVNGFGKNALYEVDGYPDKPIDMDAIPYGELKNYTSDYTANVRPSLIYIMCRLLKKDTMELWEWTWSLHPEEPTNAYDEFEYDESQDMASLHPGDEVVVKTYAHAFKVQKTWNSTVLLEGQYTVTSLNPDIVEVKDGMLICKKAGKAEVRVSLDGAPDVSITREIEVKDKEIKDGDEVTVGENGYRVSSIKNKTVSFTGSDGEAVKVTVPDTVKIQGKTYKVTSIGANAFKNNKKLTGVTVGKNVTAIGSRAFYGCKKLKKITVKSTKLKTVGKNALKGIRKKAAVKVPASRLSKYKKLFKGKGQEKTVKIKK